ncbi:MAG: oxidoreductase [Acidobacteriota bacterium]|nr:oxidoreductase [Acidobacteriota bacterium]
MIDVGLIGFGLAGRAFHAQVIHAVPGLRLAAILQRSGNEAAEKYPDVLVVRSVEELLAIREIRLVLIATPNDTHAALARACLEAGRDVVVDKPFTTTLEEAKELVALAKKLRRLITVYQNRRYDGDFQAIRQIVADGTLGRIVRFETNYDRFRPRLKVGAWRERPVPGAGILFDLAPHMIDHALVLFGLPEAVTADARAERAAAVVDDAFDVMLHYPSGMRAVLRSTMLAAAQRPRFVLQGTRGAFFKQSFDPTEINLRNGIVPESGPWGSEPEEDWGVLTTAENDVVVQRRVPSAKCDYRDYYANVRDAMLGKTELAVSPEHALNVMRILEIARESSTKRCTIPW